MNGTHDELLDLCAGHALGALDAVDEKRFRNHLHEGCPECEAALRDFRAAATSLASAAPPALPSPELKRRILADVRELAPVRKREPPRSRTPRWMVRALAAAVAALALTNLAVWQRAERFRTERDVAVTVLEQTQAELENTRALPDLVFAGDTDCFDLDGTGEGAGGLRATACVNRSSGDALVVFNGFDRPGGRDYELWALRGDRVESMGVIRVQANGHAVAQRRALSEPDQLTALAVSLEPAGGSPGPAPTGPVVMVGAVGG